MRILIFNWRDITHPWAGGAELNIHEQAKRWVQAGHDVTLFCGEYPQSSEYATIDGIEIVRKGGRFSVYLWAVVYYFMRFRGIFDVILDIENGIPFFTPLYCRTAKVCLIHHVHTAQFRTEFSPPLSWIGIFLESVMMPLSYRLVPIVTISQSSCAGLEGIGIDSKKCIVVYCGVDHSQYRPGQAKSQQPSILYLGRLRRYKRVDMLIRLMVPICERYPDAALHIVGSGPAEEPLRKAADENGLRDRVIFHGYMTEQEKVHLLQRSWVLAVPSMAEGWGLVAIEANACGTPAIAFDVPGLREAIVHRRSGLLVNNEQEFVEEICHLLQDSEFRAQLMRGALEHARQFTWDNTAAQTLRVLASAVEKARRSVTVREGQEDRKPKRSVRGVVDDRG